MGRLLVIEGSGRNAITERTNALEQRPAQLFELHQLGLLIGHNLIQFVQHLVLVCEPRFELDKAIIAHRPPLFRCLIG